MRASESNENPEVITTLIAAGANVNTRDEDGKTAYDYILKNEHLENSEARWLLNDLRFK